MNEAWAREVVRAAITDPELLEALRLLVERRYQDVPFLLRALQDEPARFVPAALRAVGTDGALDRRTAELVAVAAAASQMCEHCLRVHIEEALANGATYDEVLETLLIAARIAESSTNAVSLRVLRRVAAARGLATGGESPHE
jgi:pyruvate dehydrogenase E2 component (dihydrolipoamide acetyltransferase)